MPLHQFSLLLHAQKTNHTLRQNIKEHLDASPVSRVHFSQGAILLSMSSWEDHQEMIDDQYLMESIEKDQKLDSGEEEVEDEE